MFENILGQKLAVKLLKNAAKTDRLAGTYLFHGPSGVGKEFASKEFAKALNCETRHGDSCDECSSCQRIGQNKHPDVYWVFPVGKKRVIKISQIREMQRFASMRAFEAKKKVCVIVDAHTLNEQSSNALLKTLEEPPPNTVFILVTDSPETLLPTIRSRSQDVRFISLEKSVLSVILTGKMGVPANEAEVLSQLGLGSMGRAVSYKDEDTKNLRKFILDLLEKGPMNKMKDLTDNIDRILEMLEDYKEKLEKQMKQASSRENEDGEKDDEEDAGRDEDAFIQGEYKKRVEDVLSFFISWYRDILIYKNTKNSAAVMNKDYLEAVIQWSEGADNDKLCGKLDVVADIRGLLNKQINLKLLLQAMFLRLDTING